MCWGGVGGTPARLTTRGRWENTSGSAIICWYDTLFACLCTDRDTESGEAGRSSTSSDNWRAKVRGTAAAAACDAAVCDDDGGDDGGDGLLLPLLMRRKFFGMPMWRSLSFGPLP